MITKDAMLYYCLLVTCLQFTQAHNHHHDRNRLHEIEEELERFLVGGDKKHDYRMNEDKPVPIASNNEPTYAHDEGPVNLDSSQSGLPTAIICTLVGLGLALLIMFAVFSYVVYSWRKKEKKNKKGFIVDAATAKGLEKINSIIEDSFSNDEKSEFDFDTNHIVITHDDAERGDKIQTYPLSPKYSKKSSTEGGLNSFASNMWSKSLSQLSSFVDLDGNKKNSSNNHSDVNGNNHDSDSDSSNNIIYSRRSNNSKVQTIPSLGRPLQRKKSPLSNTLLGMSYSEYDDDDDNHKSSHISINNNNNNGNQVFGTSKSPAALKPKRLKNGRLSTRSFEYQPPNTNNTLNKNKTVFSSSQQNNPMTCNFDEITLGSNRNIAYDVMAEPYDPPTTDDESDNDNGTEVTLDISEAIY
eukprot:Awhi_evm1s10289